MNKKGITIPTGEYKKFINLENEVEELRAMKNALEDLVIRYKETYLKKCLNDFFVNEDLKEAYVEGRETLYINVFRSFNFKYSDLIYLDITYSDLHDFLLDRVIEKFGMIEK